VSEKSNPFKGIPSLFSRSSKNQDAASPPAVSADGRQLIADSKFFDAAWYLLQNPDVAASQVAPVDHYFTCGEKEGRNPGPDFDVAWYMKKYPEFAATKFGALEHYLRHGHLENKSISFAEYREKLEDDPRMFEERVALKVAPLKVYTSPPLTRRINLIVDSMAFSELSTDELSTDESSAHEPSTHESSIQSAILRGLKVSVLLAKATGSSLRIVTRVARAQVGGFKKYLLANNLRIPSQVEFVYSDYVIASASLPVSRWDIFIIVDEPNTASVRKSISERSIFVVAPSAASRSSQSPQEHADDVSDLIHDISRSCESVFV
jgi:hypothetical protein